MTREKAIRSDAPLKLLVVDNAHLVRDYKGRYYSGSVYSYRFLQRYLAVFESVRFVGKTRYVEQVDESKFARVDGPGVEIFELPWYQGMQGMVKATPVLLSRFRHAADGCDCSIYRIAQVESFLAYKMRRDRSAPFAVEVVNDPGTFSMPKWMRDYSVRMVREMCSKADGASYVTDSFLQERYPNRHMAGDAGAFESAYSSIDLDPGDIGEKKAWDSSGPLTMVHVANALNDDTKGLSTFLEALALVKGRGYSVKGISVGDGSEVDGYMALSERLGIADCVEFKGRLTGKNRVFEVLRESDILVLPTRMEGLPRTVIEAMAVGLPCLSTPIAGIPELLDGRYLFDPDDAEGFADKICELVDNPRELAAMSKKNIETARRYTSDILGKRRFDFYARLRACAEGRTR